MKKTKQNLTGRRNPPEETADQSRPAQRSKNRRESIESFVVVFVAFLVFSLEAEGFVIPTGSMAPTLMGRHKEIVCPECRDVYMVNADCEVDSDGSGAATGIRVAWGTCQNCRFTAHVDDIPSVSGDRIYTMKKDLALPLLPQAGRVGPERWEVTVFRLPEDPQIRYIKRLVGMPEEIIRIQQGDIWRRPSNGSAPFSGCADRSGTRWRCRSWSTMILTARPRCAMTHGGGAGCRSQRAGPSQSQGPMHTTRPDKAGLNSAIAMLSRTPSNGKPSAPEDHSPSRLGPRWLPTFPRTTPT